MFVVMKYWKVENCVHVFCNELLKMYVQFLYAILNKSYFPELINLNTNVLFCV